MISARALAKQQNKHIYFSGKPCRKGGHNDGRYTKSGMCVTCKAIESISYHLKNRDKDLQYHKRYYQVHIEDQKEQRREWYLEHRDSILLEVKANYLSNREDLLRVQKDYYYRTKEEHSVRAEKWRKDYPGRICENNRRRRALKKKAVPIWATNERQEILELYDLRDILTKETGIPHHVDHIVPLNSKIVCGLHCLANLRVIPAIENKQKRNKLISELVDL